MRPLKWIGYALLTIGLSLAVISAFVPMPADNASSAAADERQTPSDWHTVVTWHGDGNRSTPTFTVTGPWRIEWSTRPGRLGAASFRIFLYDAAGNIVGRVADVTGAAHSQRLLRRPGSYYLGIAGAQPYTVTVQEKA